MYLVLWRFPSGRAFATRFFLWQNSKSKSPLKKPKKKNSNNGSIPNAKHLEFEAKATDLRQLFQQNDRLSLAQLTTYNLQLITTFVHGQN